nr:hypothetical protein [Ferrimicrobium acidiphilum]
MTYLSSKQEDMEAGIMWLPVMICSKCGKQSVTTNICRQCPETPADQELNPDIVKIMRPCWYPKCMGEVHYIERDGKKIPTVHGATKMVYSGVLEEPIAVFLKSGRKLPERRAYEPNNNDQEDKLWTGYGVVFDTTTRSPRRGPRRPSKRYEQ